MELRQKIADILYAEMYQFPRVRPWDIETTADHIMIEIEDYAKEKATKRENEKGIPGRELPL